MKKKSAKHPGGRPPKYGEPMEPLHLLVPPKSKAKWQARADATGVSLSEWVRATLDAAAR